MFDWWAAFIYSQLLSRTIVFNMKCFFLSFSAKPFCQINFGFVYLWETDEASAKCGGVSDNTCMAQTQMETAFPWWILSLWSTAEQFNSLKSYQWLRAKMTFPEKMMPIPAWSKSWYLIFSSSKGKESYVNRSAMRSFPSECMNWIYTLITV